MKLKKALISGFRSIKKTESLLVDEKVTILIGANDHGKSNILTAIEYLNDENKFVADDKNWDIDDVNKVNITWHFTPSVDDLKKLADLEVVEQPVEEVLIEQASEDSAGETKQEKIKEEVFEINTDNEIIFYKNFNEGILKIKSLPLAIPLSKQNEVLQLRPRVELFTPPTTNVKDQVNLAELATPEFEFMQGIFRLAGIWDIRDQIFAQNPRTSRLLDEASVRLTKILNDKWNQGRDLNWKLKHVGTDGDHILIEIQDQSIDNRYTRPSLRSSGFRTYFLLSMIIYARTENKKENAYIYLFDEPGTYLHPNAQLDLQRSFESISDKTQIIYTTHSLFLINKNYPDRNRVVSKTKDGTRIDQKPFVKNWKSVRESLGILLSNNFLIAEKTLLVEGPSDVVYILHAIKKLKGENKVDIDLNDLSIVDAGNSGNYLAMAKLMISEGREVVALLDGDDGGLNIETQLKKVCDAELKSKKLQIHRLPDKKSTEDIFLNIDVFKNAVKNVASNLVSIGVRQFKPGLNINAEIAKIKPDPVLTLGRVLDNLSPKLFVVEDKISKLSVALEYEDLITPTTDLAPQAKNEIDSIKKRLNLKGERNEEGGVFVEV